MSADDPAALDLAPIRARLTSVNQERWARNTGPAIDPRFPLGSFIAHAPADIAALLAEVERLCAELAEVRKDLEVATMTIEGEIQDRLSDLGQLGEDFVKEWSDGL